MRAFGRIRDLQFGKIEAWHHMTEKSHNFTLHCIFYSTSSNKEKQNGEGSETHSLKPIK